MDGCVCAIYTPSVMVDSTIYN